MYSAIEDKAQKSQQAFRNVYRLICPDSSIHKFCGTNLGVIVQKWLSAP
jgi:hypothetical protein